MSLLCDCISRAEAIEALGYDISIESDEGLDAYKTVIKEMLCKIYDVQKENIEKLPSIKPQPKTGHWTERKIHKTTGFFLPTCSECGNIQPYTHHTFSWNYCPTCGAKMVKSQAESEEEE